MPINNEYSVDKAICSATKEVKMQEQIIKNYKIYSDFYTS